ncbi:hypothetical protein PQQ96_24340, partial [Paraburkholderia sediminicola]|uniref:hypothetical protein n=1 Tax=Paraburkholderia sediminicola TaxID=458836 RepID=UPI0038BC9906
EAMRVARCALRDGKGSMIAPTVRALDFSVSASAVSKAPPDRPVGEFFQALVGAAKDKNAQSPATTPISAVNALSDHGVEFHFGIRIGRCTGSLGSPI